MEMGRKKTLPSGAGLAADLPSIAGFACSITLLLTGLVLVVFGTHEVTADEITEWRYEQVAEEYQSESSDGSTSKPLLPDGAVAWLRVNGTNIDYPVAQAHESDPFFYLSHNIWGNPSGSGCSRKSSTASAHSNGKRPTAHPPSDPSAPSKSIKRTRRYRHLMHAARRN